MRFARASVALLLGVMLLASSVSAVRSAADAPAEESGGEESTENTVETEGSDEETHAFQNLNTGQLTVVRNKNRLDHAEDGDGELNFRILERMEKKTWDEQRQKDKEEEQRQKKEEEDKREQTQKDEEAAKRREQNDKAEKQRQEQASKEAEQKRAEAAKEQAEKTRQEQAAKAINRSCKDIKAKNGGAASGIYTIQPQGSSGDIKVYCDMTTDGGGWTSILLPSGGAHTLPGFSWDQSQNGHESCSGHNKFVDHNNKNTIYRYHCGNIWATGTYNWNNFMGASDVMLKLTVQGQNHRYVQLNGVNVPTTTRHYNGAGMRCDFVNGNNGAAGAMGTNACQGYRQPQEWPGYVMRGAIASRQLSLRVASGRACNPDCHHGTGWNIQDISVR